MWDPPLKISKSFKLNKYMIMVQSAAFQYLHLNLGFLLQVLLSLISIPSSQELILQIMLRELGPGVSII